MTLKKCGLKFRSIQYKCIIRPLFLSPGRFRKKYFDNFLFEFSLKFSACARGAKSIIHKYRNFRILSLIYDFIKYTFWKCQIVYSEKTPFR